MSTIRQASPEDLPKLEVCAREFYGESKFLKDFDLALFVRTWTDLLAGAGVIFLLEDGEIAGALGGVAYPDLYSGALIATEFFWFVRQHSRGGGLGLLRAFERWARQQGCVQLRMARLVDVMPERLDKVYRRLGFEPAEVNYHKELAP